MTAYLYKQICVVYVSVHKTGSTSIKCGLLGEADEFRNSPVPNDWAALYPSFSVIRHPYERMRSAIDHFKRHKLAKSEEELILRKRLDAFAAIDILQDENISWQTKVFQNRLKKHILPLTHSYYGLDRVNKIFRSDDFPKMWLALSDWLQIRVPDIAHRKAAPGRSELTKREKRAVRKAYAADFERFGYQD